MSQPTYRHIVVQVDPSAPVDERAIGLAGTAVSPFDNKCQAESFARKQAGEHTDFEFRVYELTTRFRSVTSVQQL